MTAVGFITFINVISIFKVTWFTYKMGYNKGPSTKDVRQMGRGGGFEILDIPGQGEGGGL